MIRADRIAASLPAPPQSECRDPSPRCAGPCRTAFRFSEGSRATSCCRRYCRAKLHTPVESPHDQGDHHLHAITALVAAVAVTALVVLVIRRVRFEIGAGQVVEQNLEAGAEQILPALPQVAEQRGLVWQHL